VALPQNAKHVNILFVTALSWSCDCHNPANMSKDVAHTTGFLYKGGVLFDNLERQGEGPGLCYALAIHLYERHLPHGGCHGLWEIGR
jgi:hypothetical protein